MPNNTRLIIFCLTFTSVVALALGAFLCSRGYQGAELYAGAGISGIGALGALLSKTDRQSTQDVTVTNPPTQPIPTQEA